MSELAFVISADKGVMTDERTGKPISWSNIHYLTDYREDSPDAAGYKPIKISCAPEAFDVIHKNGIGLYKLDFRTRPGAGGKPSLMLVKAEIVGQLDVFELSHYRKPDPFPSGKPAQPKPAQPETKAA
ncbi:MAG: hypothetical protein H6935_15150 [Thiobacillus sp.]|nr:hypothetical protein [Thiobacillus sp.]